MVGNLARSGDLRTARVTEAMLAVPRHSFVEGESLRASYENRPLATEFGQTISQPTVVAIMTEALELTGGERVLEIGTGSGYQTAILSLLAHDVFSIERLAPLLKKAEGVLSTITTGSIRVKVGDGALGWMSYAPFDRIIVSAAMPERPSRLLEQLAEGGRLIAPISGDAEHIVLFAKRGTVVTERRLARCSFVPLLKGEG
jgi:protein-L-isoaspartate(D-aspartate) O-methyltransferase